MKHYPFKINELKINLSPFFWLPIYCEIIGAFGFKKRISIFIR